MRGIVAVYCSIDCMMGARGSSILMLCFFMFSANEMRRWGVDCPGGLYGKNDKTEREVGIKWEQLILTGARNVDGRGRKQT